MTFEHKIKRLKAEIKRLRSLILKDELTGLLNRRGFLEQGAKIFKEALFTLKRPEKRRVSSASFLTLLFLDLDHFKKINDRFGHQAGDRALQSFGRLILKRVRATDLAARLGGEEFAILLPSANEEDGRRIGEEIRATLKKQPLRIGRRRVILRTSIGVATLKSNTPSLAALIQRADKTMYLVKKEGGDGVKVAF